MTHVRFLPLVLLFILLVHFLHQVEPVQELVLGPDELSAIGEVFHLDVDLCAKGHAGLGDQ